MRFLVAPDSFKGTLSSLETCSVLASGIAMGYPEAVTRALPLADGGAGTMDALLTTFGGEQVDVTVTGPTGAPVLASYAVLPDGCAVVEMAAACGRDLVEEGVSPAKTTTAGLGQLIAHAARRGCGRILVGIGSSCTTDGGCGMAHELGVRFLDRYVEPFVPDGSTLARVESVDASGLLPELAGVRVQAVCAATNPLCGAMGTARVLGPGKGAVPTVVSELDAGLAHLAGVVAREVGVDVLHMPGAGAGGGVGAAMAAFLDARPELGVDAVLDLSDFDALLAQADVVVTGEGCFDAQSLHGKVISGVAARAKARGVPVVAVVGAMDESLVEAGHALGVTTFAPASPSDLPLGELTRKPRSRLERTMARVAALLRDGHDLPRYLAPEPAPAR